MRAPWAVALAAAGLACAVAGCAHGEGVVRVVDGKTITGAFVSPDAYAAYLRGALAESAGDWPGAVTAYTEAVRQDPGDPEPWTRVASAMCHVNSHDRDAGRAFAQALSIDAAYAPAHEARARCLETRGDERRTAKALEDARAAAAEDPRDVGAQATLARLAPESEAPAMRAKLVALTLASGATSEAWKALASWARAHGDAALEGQAWAHVAVVGASESDAVAEAARRLAGQGETVPARSVAAALIDAGGFPRVSPDARPLVARLAVDEALVRGDADRATARAARVHLGLDATAARGVLVGRPKAARAIASLVTAADPTAAGARMALALAGDALHEPSARIAVASLASARAPESPVAPEIAVLLGRAVSRTVSTDAAVAVLRSTPRDPFVPGDAMTDAIAADLGARGLLDETALSADARIELAARKSERPRPADVAAADARHRLLALALTAPWDPSATRLASLLEPAASHDGVIAVALVRMSIAGSIPRAPSLATQDPSDPLVSAAAVDLALRANDTAALPKAIARLAAVARTEAERERIRATSE